MRAVEPLLHARPALAEPSETPLRASPHGRGGRVRLPWRLRHPLPTAVRALLVPLRDPRIVDGVDAPSRRHRDVP